MSLRPEYDLTNRYEAGLGVIGQSVDMSSRFAVISIAGMDHLYAVEIFPQYELLRHGFGSMASRTPSDCIENYATIDGDITIVYKNVGLIALRKINDLGISCLDRPTLQQLLQFIRIIRKEINSGDRTSGMMGLHGAAALFELMFCSETREEIVSRYYKIARPMLVMGSLLSPLENLEGSGLAPPMYEFMTEQ